MGWDRGNHVWDDAVLGTSKRAAAALTFAAAIAASTAALAAPAPLPPPKLIVAISVDQFSAGLFNEWRAKFTGGMGRLAKGVVYTNGYQSHAATETCPGHSTLLTGVHPNRTGIIGNDYRNPDTGKSIYCLEDASVTRAEGGTATPVGPGRLMATTLGDWLKAASPQSRVVAVSGKDRGAINMAGHNGDGVFWLQPGYGYTTYVRPGEDAEARLAPMKAMNARIKAVWAKAPTWRYTARDCRAREATYDIDGKAWTAKIQPTGWGESDKPADIQRDVMASPLNDEFTAAAARDLIDWYRLGRGPAVDILAVSFSGTDTVGHRWGTAGPEMCEQMHRLDAAVGSVLAKLDSLKIPYVVALAADHGGSDFPQRLSARGYTDAHSIDSAGAFKRVEAAVMAQFNLTASPLSGTIEEINVAAPAGVDKAQLEAAVAAAAAAQPEVAAAFTQTELLATKVSREKPPEELTLKERFAESTYPGRSPDVSVALQPYTVARTINPGFYMSSHGTVWNYDRRIPILFWWPGATPEERFLPLETIDIAPTLAATVGLAPPADLDGRCRTVRGSVCPAVR
jgi:predicted AlkP superfamily pyrophosphatase or phosphodiesterase